MSSYAPRTPQEALSRAATLVENLRHRLPGKVGTVLNCIDDILDALQNQEAAQFPFNLIIEEVNALAEHARLEFEDPEQTVAPGSMTYDRVLHLYHRCLLSVEFLAVSRVYEGVEKRYERIERLLPAKNYAIDDLLSDIINGQLTDARSDLARALAKFGKGEYSGVLRDCGEAAERMFGLFERVVLPEFSGSIYMRSRLDKVRKHLSDKNKTDREGYPLSPSGRIEWLLLNMFEVMHYLRNAVSHPPGGDERLPSWQHERRNLARDKPEYARLALCLSFQTALELQALLHGYGCRR